MITAHIASIQGRGNSLQMAVMSIYYQVDHIYVGLNNYKTIPEFLNDKKITFVQLDNSTGDAAKFYFIEQVSGYAIICDDDLIYPESYVYDMIEAVNKHKCIVTLHGRSFNVRPVLNYYKSATDKYRCLGDVTKDVQVHVGGTGVMAFDTNIVKVKYSDFKAPNMADIWMAKIAKEQGVPIMVLAHKSGYLKYTSPRKTIYEDYANNCEFQTNLINQIL